MGTESTREEMYRKSTLTTSPYFLSCKTPASKCVSDSDEEAEGGTRGAWTQRKRQRLTFRGVTPDEFLSPPTSPEELSQALRAIKPILIQERVCDDPWKIIVATTLLNKTNGKVAIPVFWELIKRWPTPTALAQASAPSLTQLLRPLGTQSVRTSRLLRLSNVYATHPPALLPQSRLTSGHNAERVFWSAPTEDSPASSYKPHTENNIIHSTDEPTTMDPSRISAKGYRAMQKKSPIAHLPFTGPYAVDSFRIFSSALDGGGAGVRVEEQLGRISNLTKMDQHPPVKDDFDESPSWYRPSRLYVRGDDDAEWRSVWPEDKQLRRYLVWRWAIEGVEYDPETNTRRPADWSYLNGLIRR